MHFVVVYTIKPKFCCLQVKAHDPDDGDNGIVRYHFADNSNEQHNSGSNDCCLFDLNSTTGEITVNGSIDYEKEVFIFFLHFILYWPETLWFFPLSFF